MQVMQANSLHASAGKAAATVPNNCAVHFRAPQRVACYALENREPSLLIPGGSNSNINPRPGTGPSKLILPGRQGPPSGGMGGRIIIPEQGTEKILAQGAQALGPELTTITGPNRYRPPAGFMNEDMSPENMETLKASPEEMLSRLRARAGRWHTLAKLLPALATAHFNASAVDELTGITPLEQSRWITAATVYDSLVQSGKMSEEVLEHFDVRGDELLEPFRFLTQDMRVEAALYIVEKDLDPPECEVLARAMKEWDRRPKERTGFSNLPADCMAFKHLRDAGECRKPDDIEANLVKAMKAAVTDGARARIEQATQELLGTDAAGTQAGPGSLAGSKSTLVVLRLDPEDIGVRPLPVLGAYGEAAVEDLEAAPRASQEGTFGAFTIASGQGSSSWVCLPQWKALAMAQHPVALSLADCSVVPAVVQALKCKVRM
uniref:Uncharacterized protein n=1 Tax=Dunaliella tertiolecta TaxID=3047 RepID=A0A7S3QWT1_DUNTE